MEGFFDRMELVVRQPVAREPNCGKCGLYKGCQSPKMGVAGKGKKKIMIIGEAPGATEDEHGKPFIGEAGQRLQRELRSAGIEIFNDCWVTNALSCRPPNNVIQNERSIDHCRPLVLRAIETHRPRTIILCGRHAVKSVVGHLWNETIGPLKRWTGWRIPHRKWNCWICPTWHPSWLLRLHDDPLADREFRQHIRWAAKQEKRPYAADDVTDYESWIDMYIDPDDAVVKLGEIIDQEPMIAFDYETNCVRPSIAGSELFSCSVSTGKHSFAFPWYGKPIQLMKEILGNSKIKKIGWNIKFEEIWTRAKLGIPVRGWHWDGMTAAHALDCRAGGITGLAFQEFIRLGVENHKDEMDIYLKAKGGGINRIKEVPLKKLLEYNAYDSLYEYLIAEQQMEEFGL